MEILFRFDMRLGFGRFGFGIVLIGLLLWEGVSKGGIRLLCISL